MAGVATCLLANFAAVYLSAPTVVASAAGAAAAGGGSALGRFLAQCPDNAFQTVLAGAAPYTLLQASPPPPARVPAPAPNPGGWPAARPAPRRASRVRWPAPARPAVRAS